MICIATSLTAWTPEKYKLQNTINDTQMQLQH